MLLAYAYTDAYSASDVRDADFGRVVSSGDPLINIPENSFNLLLTKDFDLGGHALTVGGSVKYVSKRLGETGTKFFLPSYTLVRLFATYDFSKAFSITGEVSNLTDEVYYPASYAALWVTPGAPRQYQIRASYRF
jgi:iron complex outermembrane receptor protein